MTIRFAAAVCFSVFLFSSCSSSSQDWSSPAAISDVKVKQSLVPSKNDLASFESFRRIASGDFKYDVLVGFTSDNSLSVTPSSCLAVERYLLTDDFWITSQEDATDNMGPGYSGRYTVNGEQQLDLHMSIFEDKNAKEQFLLDEIKQDLKNCSTVAIDASNKNGDYKWTTTFNFSSTTNVDLRVDMETEYDLNGKRYKTSKFKFIRQVGRNLISVAVAHTVEKSIALKPLSPQEEKDALALLQLFSNNLLAKK